MPKPELKNTVSKSDRDTLRKVHTLRSAAARTFQEKWDSAKENARFYRLLQYSDAQLGKLRSNKRVPYVLDYITSAMNSYMGVQRDQRTDVSYLPIENNDEVKTEVANMVKDAMMRDNQFQFLESDVFQDGIIEKVGAIGYDWSTEKNPLGTLKMYRIPPRQLVWDVNRRNYSIEDSTWVSRTRLYPKRTLAQIFPEHADDIMRLSISSNLLDALGLDDTYLRQIVDSELDSIALIEFYEKDYTDKTFIVNEQDDSISDENYDTKKDAERAIKEKIDEYEQKIKPIFLLQKIQPPPSPQYSTKTVSYPIVVKSEVLHYLILTDQEKQEQPFYPYDLYYPFWHDGEWWSVMDTMKDAQRFINKTFLKIDNQMSRSSNGLLLVDDQVPEAEAKKIIEGWSTTGGAFRIKDAKNNVNFIPPPGFDPRLIGAMDVAITNLEKKAGGANFLGHRETASESGVAVRQRIEQGSLSSFVVFDNLSRWKRSVGEKVLWYISNYMTAAQKIRIQGKELTDLAKQKFPQWFAPSMRENMGYLSVNTHPNNTLEGLKADVIVDEAKHSVTKNQQTLQTIAALGQSFPQFAETVSPSMLLDLLPLPATEKERYKAEQEQLMQAKLQKEQADAQKPPSITATLSDIEKLDPQAQAQFIQKFFGIQIGAPMTDDTLIKEALKHKTALELQANDIAFKERKHIDQTTLKGLETMSSLELEKQKLEKEKSNGTSQLQGA